ncbi:MAG TPA: ABC transporter substrate-binding protein [Burkholderiaceae bacterium]|nr:ABC transporter substrate-binding protein [Burkholderiaceae bacterium]
MHRRNFGAALAAALALAAAGASAQSTRVDVAISGSTAFAPFTLAKAAGIFDRHHLDVSLRKVTESYRGLALASGGVQCAAARADNWIVWSAAGLAATQIFEIARSGGEDVLVARPGIAKVADLKGRAVAAGARGTSSYFLLAWFLAHNGASIRDVRVVGVAPQSAAAAFATGSGDIDAALTSEPYAGMLRDRSNALATSADASAVLDTFGCTNRFLAGGGGVARAIADSYFEALELIKREPQKSYAIMAADVKQSVDQFEASQKGVRWQDRAANRRSFARDHAATAREAADLLVDIGVIPQAPDIARLADARYIP